jgi:two-component sensor histidine kinase
MERLFETIRYFFTSDTLNPHGICLLWRPELIWTHAVSDVLIGIAYFSIPLALGVFIYHRRDVRFGWAIWMFVAFIMLCGVTHFMMVWTLWNADYGVEALVKAATATASVVTAVALWPLLPRVIALPSPAQLEARVVERDQAVSELKRAMADMVEMREHERRQKLLLDELNHRVKNTLASVQSIASQTLRKSDDVEQAREVFLERLMALARTHDLLVNQTWRSVRFRDMVDGALGYYDKPYSYEGPDLELQPNFAVTLGMALHELATNAVKYGAWAGEGTISITVTAELEPGSVCITWTERGGRSVLPPTRRGFGSRLLERGVAGELGGSVQIDYRPEGLVCTIRTEASAKIRPS